MLEVQQDPETTPRIRTSEIHGVTVVREKRNEEQILKKLESCLSNVFDSTRVHANSIALCNLIKYEFHENR